MNKGGHCINLWHESKTWMQYGFRQIISSPTRVTFQSKSVIDLIFTNIMSISEIGTIDISISDHLPVYMVKKMSRHKHTSLKVTCRNYKGYDSDTYCNIVEGDWRWRYFWEENVDTETLWCIMLQIFTSAADKICPMKEFSRRVDEPKWFTSKVRKGIQKKNVLYKKAAASGKSEHWKIFKKYKRATTILLRHSKRNYIVQTINDNRSDPKRFWQELGENFNIGRHSKKAQLSKVVDSIGNIQEGLAAADAANQYYVSMGKKLNDKFTKEWEPNNFLKALGDTHIKFNFSFVTEKVVDNVLKCLPINKSSGVTNLSSMILRDGMRRMITESTFLINECIRTEHTPNDWKLGTITPLPKGSNISLDPGDWRPVSVLPMPSKVLERIVYDQLIYYFESYGLLFSNQHGFRKCKSTTTAIMEFIQFYMKSMTDD